MPREQTRSDRSTTDPAGSEFFNTLEEMRRDWMARATAEVELSLKLSPCNSRAFKRSHVCAMVVQNVMAVTDAPQSVLPTYSRVGDIVAQGPLCPCPTNTLINARPSGRFAQAALEQCPSLEPRHGLATARPLYL